jgi:uncharacterized protein (DUF1810 family)
MTLFSRVPTASLAFRDVLAKYFGALPDARTAALLDCT